jgi:hypothetical protein
VYRYGRHDAAFGDGEYRGGAWGEFFGEPDDGEFGTECDADVVIDERDGMLSLGRLGG